MCHTRISDVMCAAQQAEEQQGAGVSVVCLHRGCKKCACLHTIVSGSVCLCVCLIAAGCATFS